MSVMGVGAGGGARVCRMKLPKTKKPITITPIPISARSMPMPIRRFNLRLLGKSDNKVDDHLSKYMVQGLTSLHIPHLPCKLGL
jgi:hypothetical protein